VSQVIDWSALMARVPRELFIPDRIWRLDRGRAGNDLVPVDRCTDPRTWTALVAGDEPVITQVDNGQPAQDGTGAEVTSSCSDRRVVADMLGLLAAQPGDRVLEVGTGTGWNAALLAAAGAKVISVEIDPALARDAVARIESVGYGVEVVVGDGLIGWPAKAPYDRVVATVGVDEVPWAWVGQTRVGGRLVAPLTNSWYPPGLVALTRGVEVAVGRLAGPANFMPVRARAVPRRRTSDLVPTHTGTTDVHPYYLTGHRDAAVAIGQRVREISFAWRSTDNSDDGMLWLYGPGSWATINATHGPPYDVEQAGPRRLVDEVLDAYRWWRNHGEPSTEDWSVTVGPAGQRLTLTAGS
jgi:protein-L-isoaspartate(D-aspartate) O-methyltransferase